MDQQYTATEKRRHVIAFGVAIVVLTVVAYHNSFHGPFVFDDLQAIVENPSIRDLSNVGAVLSPPLFATGAVGRPVVNLSFAVNYAFFGTKVFGYHVTNLFIHICAALVLFGILRRTAMRAGRERVEMGGAAPLSIAGFGTLLWAVHPLLTESVTAVVQRSESLLGLFFLLTLYCFIRSSETKTPNLWRVAAVVFCFLGAATKEVMVICPLLVLLYDRSFVSKTFSSAWQTKRWFYLALFSSWGVVLYLTGGTDGRNQTVGFGYGVEWWEYLLTQCYGVADYLLLAVLPRDLIFDYGTYLVTEPMKVVPGAILLCALFGVTIRAVIRGQTVGFLGAWFFLILAPSSSILPLTTQTLAEHRMYLPLVSVVLSGTLLLLRLGKKGMVVAASLVPLLMFGTVRRNTDYQSALALWSDTVQKLPTNARAHNDLANALFDDGRAEEALEHFQKAISLDPKSAINYYNMANALVSLKRPDEAAEAFRTTILLNPKHAKAHNNLGNLLVRTDRGKRAAAHFVEAAKLMPQNILYQMNAGNALMSTGRFAEAVHYLRRVLEIDPNNIDAIANLGAALAHAGDIEAAASHFERAITAHPEVASLRYNFGKILAKKGMHDAAIAAYKAALRLNPNYPEAHYNIGNIRLEQGRFLDAIAAYTAAVALKPDYVSAYNNLGGAYKRIGETEKARVQYEHVLRIQPNHPRARRSLAELQ